VENAIAPQSVTQFERQTMRNGSVQLLVMAGAVIARWPPVVLPMNMEPCSAALVFGEGLPVQRS
jgi:hypothetical protein